MQQILEHGRAVRGKQRQGLVGAEHGVGTTIESAQEPADRGRIDNDVGVDEDEDVPLRRLRSVVAGPSSSTPTRPVHNDVGDAASDRAGVVERGVVDDDDLGAWTRAVADGLKAIGDRCFRVVRRDDNGDPATISSRLAPLCPAVVRSEHITDAPALHWVKDAGLDSSFRPPALGYRANASPCVAW